MNQRSILSIALLCAVNIVNAQQEISAPLSPADKISVATAEKPAGTGAQVTPETTHAPQQAAPHIKPKPRPKPRTNAFYRFVRIFLILLSNEQIQNNVKMIEKLFTALMQTAYQVIQTANPLAATPKRSDLEQTDKALVAELKDGLLREVTSLKINRKQHNHSHGKMDEQTKEILINFSGIVQNFFNILQDPENPQTVPAGIIGMLAGMVNIGTIAMTKGNLSIDADYEQIKAYAKELDAEVKENMYRIILSTKERSGISIS